MSTLPTSSSSLNVRRELESFTVEATSTLIRARFQERMKRRTALFFVVFAVRGYFSRSQDDLVFSSESNALVVGKNQKASAGHENAMLLAKQSRFSARSKIWCGPPLFLLTLYPLSTLRSSLNQW
jgi:hypothetical protein